VRLKRLVALQAVVAVKALQVEHRVDAHAVRVRPRRRAHDHDRAPDLSVGELFDLVL
jgi:hypothetical protein